MTSPNQSNTSRGPKPGLTKNQSRIVRDVPDAARLFDKVVAGNNGCWQWCAATTGGYGSMAFRGKNWKASRVSYTLFCGEIPGALLVCHHCDNPGCVNPSHLFLGHHSTNMKDMVRKGRGKSLISADQSHFKSGHAPRGEDGSGAKISETVAREIIKLAATGENTSVMARRFSIARTTVQRILRGDTWRHLARPPGLPRSTGRYTRTAGRAALQEQKK